MSQGLRILLRADDPVRRQGLAAMLEAAGHALVTETPDVVLCDLARDAEPPGEAEAPVVVLTDRAVARRTASRRIAARRSPRSSSTPHCAQLPPACWCERRAAFRPTDSVPPATTRRRC